MPITDHRRRSNRTSMRSLTPPLAVVPASGAQLVEAHRHGEPEAFTEIYERYYAPLVRLLVARTGNDQLARELAHDSLVRALLRLDSYDASRPLWPWLSQIAVNLAIDQFRRRHRELPASDLVGDVEPDHADDAASRALVVEALRRVSPRQREALVLCYLEDWQPARAAQRLGLGRGAFDQLLFRARASLLREYRRLEREAPSLRALLPWVAVSLLWSRARARVAAGARLASSGPAGLLQSPADAVAAAMAAVAVLSSSAVAMPPAPSDTGEHQVFAEQLVRAQADTWTPPTPPPTPRSQDRPTARSRPRTDAVSQPSDEAVAGPDEIRPTAVATDSKLERGRKVRTKSQTSVRVADEETDGHTNATLHCRSIVTQAVCPLLEHPPDGDQPGAGEHTRRPDPRPAPAGGRGLRTGI